MIWIRLKSNRWVSGCGRYFVSRSHPYAPADERFNLAGPGGLVGSFPTSEAAKAEGARLAENTSLGVKPT